MREQARAWVTNPTAMRKLNGWLTIFWLVMIPTSIVTGWVNSVQYVSALSLWALVSGHLGAWQSARAGEDVVEAIVADERIETK